MDFSVEVVYLGSDTKHYDKKTFKISGRHYRKRVGIAIDFSFRGLPVNFFSMELSQIEETIKKWSAGYTPARAAFLYKLHTENPALSLSMLWTANEKTFQQIDVADAMYDKNKRFMCVEIASKLRYDSLDELFGNAAKIDKYLEGSI